MNVLSIYMNEVFSLGPILTKEQEMEIATRIASGDSEAKQILFERNLRLVINRAKKYVDHGLPLEDLIQVGNIGLLKAVEGFDVTRGNRFSTYAVPKIDREMEYAYISTSRIIKVPVIKYEMIQKLRKMQTLLSEKLYHDPTIRELAEALEISEEECELLMEWEKDVISLQAVNSKEEREYIIDPGGEYLEDTMRSQWLKEDVLGLLSILSEREQEIISMIFGLRETKPMSDTEIAAIYGISRKRISQIKATVLKKLRKAKQTENLAIYMDNPSESLENLEFFKEEYKNSSKKYLMPMERPKEYVKKGKN